MDNVVRDDVIYDAIKDGEILYESVIELNPTLILDKITGHVFLIFN